MNPLVRACRRLWRWVVGRVGEATVERRPSDQDPAWRDPNAEIDTRAGGSTVCLFCGERRPEEVVFRCEKNGSGREGCVAVGGER